jgi:hypothetical protein
LPAGYRSDWRQLSNARAAVALLLIIAFALGVALWFVVIGRPVTSSSGFVITWCVWASCVVLYFGDEVLCNAIELADESAKQVCQPPAWLAGWRLVPHACPAVTRQAVAMVGLVGITSA